MPRWVSGSAAPGLRSPRSPHGPSRTLFIGLSTPTSNAATPRNTTCTLCGARPVAARQTTGLPRPRAPRVTPNHGAGPLGSVEGQPSALPQSQAPFVLGCSVRVTGPHSLSGNSSSAPPCRCPCRKYGVHFQRVSGPRVPVPAGLRAAVCRAPILRGSFLRGFSLVLWEMCSHFAEVSPLPTATVSFPPWPPHSLCAPPGVTQCPSCPSPDWGLSGSRVGRTLAALRPLPQAPLGHQRMWKRSGSPQTLSSQEPTHPTLALF